MYEFCHNKLQKHDPYLNLLYAICIFARVYYVILLKTHNYIIEIKKKISL